MTEQHTPEKQETSKVAKPEKHYRALKPGDRIDRCSYLLPNQLQCWKAGEEEVTTTDAEGRPVVYQYCERHVRIQRAIDQGLLKAEVVSTTLGEMTTDPGPVPPLPEDKEATPPKGESKKEAEHSGDSKQQENKQQQTSGSTSTPEKQESFFHKTEEFKDKK